RPPGLRPQRLYSVGDLGAIRQCYAHQSSGAIVLDVEFVEAGVSAEATAVPTRPRNNPVKTASASRLTRVAFKMTPFAWLGTPMSQPISPTGPGLRHATP